MRNYPAQPSFGPVSRYVDLTNSDEASELADQVPELREAFVALGFRPLGYLGHDLGNNMLRVCEVLCSARGDAFLSLVLHPPSPLKTEPRIVPAALLQTAMSNGFVVSTTNGSMQYRLLNHPLAGSYLEGTQEATPAELWDLHRQRTHEIALDSDQAILRHDDMRLCIEIGKHCFAVAMFGFLLSSMFGLVGLVGLVILFVSVMQSLFGLAVAGGGPWAPVIFLGGGAFLSVGMVFFGRARLIASWLGGEWLVRQLPWPRVRPWAESTHD